MVNDAGFETVPQPIGLGPLGEPVMGLRQTKVPRIVSIALPEVLRSFAAPGLVVRADDIDGSPRLIGRVN
jgi:hypothetical protein